MPSAATARATIYTLSLHDALPISLLADPPDHRGRGRRRAPDRARRRRPPARTRSEEHTSELQSLRHLVCLLLLRRARRSTLFPYTTLFRSRFSLTRLTTADEVDAALQIVPAAVARLRELDRKSTRLNSSHLGISYAFCCYGARDDLHSFPTRRSSDLASR